MTLKYLSPFWLFDCLDDKGQPDHGKTMATLAFFLFCWLVFRVPGWPPIGLTVVFLSAMFGPRMFYRFLNRTQA